MQQCDVGSIWAALGSACLLIAQRREATIRESEAHSNIHESEGVTHSLFQRNSQQSSEDFQLCPVLNNREFELYKAHLILLVDFHVYFSIKQVH